MRSPRLLDAQRSALVIVDIQEKLLPKIIDHQRLLWNSSRAARGAQVVGVPVLLTEQYPKGLGGTVSPLDSFSSCRHEKTAFSVCGATSFREELGNMGIEQVVLCGIETHICVTQSALDLSANGFDVYVVVDAVGARHELDHLTALNRLRDEGVTLLTTETLLFEWSQDAMHERFAEIRALVMESPLGSS